MSVLRPLDKIKNALKSHFSSKKPTIVDAHTLGLSPDKMHKNARIVMEGLHDAGFQAYVVGGGVRDQLLGREPKDFDITTNAHPESIKSLFKRAIIIGRRFRLVLVHFYRDTVEVATFRGQQGHEEKMISDEGMLLRDNNFTASLKEDAYRRDFTVNALYYDMAEDKIIDYTRGLIDLKKGLIRLIGEPRRRYQEDPVRMLRAVRLASKLGFRIEKKTAQVLSIQGNTANVMDSETYETFDLEIPEELKGQVVDLIKYIDSVK